MVKVTEHTYILDDGSVDTKTWLADLLVKLEAEKLPLLETACELAQQYGANIFDHAKQSCVAQGLHMADLLVELNVDQITIACAFLYPTVEFSDLSLDEVAEQINEEAADLIAGTKQMEAVRYLPWVAHTSKDKAQSHLDNLRKMLLAMAEDLRVVLIKLAQRTCEIRQAKKLPEAERIPLAEEIRNIYAPLANRLGIGHIKWELEDLAFRYLQADDYKSLAKQVDERRIDREKYVQDTMSILKKAIEDSGITNVDIKGRAKHIFSIYRKMQRKHVDFEQIYDASAMRVLVNTIEDCYSVLSIAHTLWQQIPEEFDDYISNPKPNGYRSLHTAVVGPRGKNIEIQIRTHKMHEESELGVAAHWKYKEGGQDQGNFEDKIAWLRQLLDWQRELAAGDESRQLAHKHLFDDRVYVFTPAGEIIDLPKGATPLDFAYYIHSQVGHRCRGAKINNKIVPLTYQLQTGERIEVLTSKHPRPSRDWLNQQAGYITTSRARNKIHHWFNQQDFSKHLSEGEHILEQELKRLGISQVDYQAIAKKYHFRAKEDVLAAIGRGDLGVNQVTNFLQTLHSEEQAQSNPEVSIVSRPKAKSKLAKGDINIQGIGDLLSYIARCCKPLPGDPIIGFITRGRGIAIHHQECKNINTSEHPERLIAVNWNTDTEQYYPVDLVILAQDRSGLIKDITTLLANEKISILTFSTTTNARENTAQVSLTIEVDTLEKLARLVERFKAMPNVLEVSRENG